MKPILAILLLTASLWSVAQPPFKAGPYKPGDEVTHAGKVYVNVKGCAMCKAVPLGNSYWKGKAGPVLTLDSLERYINIRLDRIEKMLSGGFQIQTSKVPVIDTVKGIIYYK